MEGKFFVYEECRDEALRSGLVEKDLGRGRARYVESVREFLCFWSAWLSFRGARFLSMSWKTIDNPLFAFEPIDRFAKFHFDLATKSPPAELFHYTSGDSFLSIINSQRMLATERSYLNDPQEFQWGFGAIQARLASQGSKYTADFLEQTHAAITEKTFDNLRLFVLSLSANPDLLSQWRAYAAEGTGFAIGLDGAALRDRAGFGETVLKEIDLDKLPNDFVYCYHLLPVVYEKSRQQEVLDGFLDAAYAFWLGIKDKRSFESLQLFRMTFEHRAKELIISLKNPGYKEECEWRIVAAVHKNSKKIEYRNGRFGITPYVTLNLSRRGDLPRFRLPITKIWAGPNSPTKANPRGVEMLCENRSIQVPLLFSEIEYRS
jgi:hypothetical protein